MIQASRKIWKFKRIIKLSKHTVTKSSSCSDMKQIHNDLPGMAFMHPILHSSPTESLDST